MVRLPFCPTSSSYRFFLFFHLDLDSKRPNLPNFIICYNVLNLKHLGISYSKCFKCDSNFLINHNHHAYKSFYIRWKQPFKTPTASLLSSECKHIKQYTLTNCSIHCKLFRSFKFLLLKHLKDDPDIFSFFGL